MTKFAATFAIATVATVATFGRSAAAQTPPDATDDTTAEVASENDSPGYSPSEPAGSGPGASALHVNGYVDVGFAKAQGDGTSFSSDDAPVPADYGVDAFATAVNSRGDVASTDSQGRFVNGFLPRSVGIAGRPSFLLNNFNLDLRFQPASAPIMIFSRVQFLPRFSSTGDTTRVYVEQAFGRVTPFESQELSLSVGKFDSVVGIEYQDNASPIRIGITPSLAARYTTGTSVGAKAFYRFHVAPLWSALSLNVAATNSGSMVESLQSPEQSWSGAPVLAGRLGYELSPPMIQVKLGASLLRGPRNDQQSRDAKQRLWALDGRLFVAGFALSGEYVHIDEDEGIGPKTTSLGVFPFASGFHARVYWAQASYALNVGLGALNRVVPYARYERRHAWFQGFVPITVDRMTAGLRIDLWDFVAVKGEYLRNRELAGAPNSTNDVYTSSAVFSW